MPKLKALALLLVVAVFAACGPEEDTRMPSNITTVPCELGTQSAILRPVGFLALGEFWTCPTPPAGAGNARFTAYDGLSYLVSGGSTAFTLTWEGTEAMQDETLIVGVSGERGYYVMPAPSGDNPMVAEFYLSQTAMSGSRNIYIAVDNGSGTPDAPSVGAFLNIPIDIIRVGGGDVQVSLNWNTPTDVDLHVVEPGGDEIFYGSRTSATGGQLDLDSNAACNLDNKNNENIFWNTGTGPAGEYIVRVDLWDACATATSGANTSYRVTVVRDGTRVDAWEGVFTPDQATHGGAGAGVEVGRFTYP